MWRVLLATAAVERSLQEEAHWSLYRLCCVLLLLLLQLPLLHLTQLLLTCLRPRRCRVAAQQEMLLRPAPAPLLQESVHQQMGHWLAVRCAALAALAPAGRCRQQSPPESAPAGIEATRPSAAGNVASDEADAGERGKFCSIRRQSQAQLHPGEVGMWDGRDSCTSSVGNSMTVRPCSWLHSGWLVSMRQY